MTAVTDMRLPGRNATAPLRSAGQAKDWSQYEPAKVRSSAEMEAAVKARSARKAVKAAAPKKGVGKAYASSPVKKAEPAGAAKPDSATIGVGSGGGMYKDIPPPTEGSTPKETTDYWKGVARRLQKELTTLQRRVTLEGQNKEEEVRRLQRENQSLKEVNEELGGKCQELKHSIKELRREGEAELAQNSRAGSQAEKRAASIEKRLAGKEELIDKQITSAKIREENLKRERDALASGLAAVSEAAVGGRNVTPATLTEEAEAAIAEGADPLPRRHDAWVKFSYGMSSFSDSDMSRTASRRVGGDGERAVAALVAAVSRLHHRRKEAEGGEAAALDQVEALQVVIQRVEREYESVRMSLEALEGAAVSVAPRTVKQRPGKQKGLSARILGVTEMVNKIEQVLRKTESDNQSLKAQLLELHFYSKLHERLIAQARLDMTAPSDTYVPTETE